MPVEIGFCPQENVICITNRRLCKDAAPRTGRTAGAQSALSGANAAFLHQIRRVAAARPRQIILREKDMTPADYEILLLQCKVICDAFEVPLFAHTFVDAARHAGIKKIHLPLPALIAHGRRPDGFEVVGTSIHSLEEAQTAAALGADYVTAGHIFDTDCKKGLPGRGLAFLKDVCSGVSLPVYAIGGITPENMARVLACGAAGGCMMSSLMTAPDPKRYLAGVSKAST